MILALNSELFDEFGLEGNSQDYYNNTITQNIAEETHMFKNNKQNKTKLTKITHT